MRTFALLSSVALLLASIFGASLLSGRTVQATSSACGFTWVESDIPEAGRLVAIKALSATDVWVSGWNKLQHWDGTSWNEVPLPVDGFIQAFDATSPNDVWGVGSLQTVPSQSFILHWNGQEWSVSHIAERDAHSAVLALSPTDVWAAGSSSWHFDGETWKEIPAPNWIYDLVGFTSNDIWAVGNTGTHLKSPVASHWDGAKWSVPYDFGGTGSGAGLYGVAGVSPQDLWAVGTSGPTSLTAHWTGEDWESVDSRGYDLYDVLALAADQVYAVGGVIERWDGEKWNLESDPTGSLYSLDAVSGDEIWAVGFEKAEDYSDRSLLMRGFSTCSTPTPSPSPTKISCALTRPKLLLPAQNAVVTKKKPTFTWNQQDCATTYSIVVKRDTRNGESIVSESTNEAQLKAPPFVGGHTYHWRVRACNADSCGKWSKWRQFLIQ